MSSPNLRNVRNFDSLIRYLEDELGWPLEGYKMDDISYEFEAEKDLHLKPEDAAKVKSVRQLRPLTSSQPWGIFFIEFDKKKLPVVVLRCILSHLVLKKRASASAADAKRWSAQDILFVSAFGPEDADGREIGFAHFHEEEGSGDLPSLRVLGWDGADTSLKLQTIACTLKDRLRWPDRDESAPSWRQRWSGAFRQRPGQIIRTSDMLAEALAALAKRIRDAAQTKIKHETERGPFRALHKAFQTNLIHDLTEDGFADTYAQTITYGLLTAAISRTDMSGDLGTALIAENISDMVPITNPFLKEMLQTFLKVGGRKGGMDFDELGIQDVVELLRDRRTTDLKAVVEDFGNKTRGEDPVIHFYEHFLDRYDRVNRQRRGVYYTPQPVVGYIVRSVHELLQTELGLEDGLASTVTWGEMIQKNPKLELPHKVEGNPSQGTISESEPFVQILDPATGTGTFLVETIEIVAATMKAKWGRAFGLQVPAKASDIASWKHPKVLEKWNEYVPNQLLPRLHGYELMMAPYAIAHMKIGLKLTETGYRFGTEERAHIYLTNALEEPEKQLRLTGFDALDHESASVNKIKRTKKFTIVIGNPPYSKKTQNLGAQFLRLIEPFRFFSNERIREPGAILFERDINNDYVKFFGFYRLLIKSANVGILGVITSSSYLDGKNFRGVRDAIVANFDEISVLNLHGDSRSGALAREGTMDVNVFDIETGVSILLAARTSVVPACDKIAYSEFIGTFEQKAALLNAFDSSSCKVTTSPIDSRRYKSFLPSASSMLDEYADYKRLDEIFGLAVDGIKTSRDGLVIANTRQECCAKIQAFMNFTGNAEDLRVAFGISVATWNYKAAQIHLRKHFSEDRIFRLAYRPLDFRYIYYDPELVFSHRAEKMSHLIRGANIALVCASRLSAKGFNHILPADCLVEMKYASHDTNSRVFPAWLYEESLLSSHAQQNSGKPASELAGVQEKGLDWMELIEAIYAVLNSTKFRSRYLGEIKNDFPRIPPLANPDLRRNLACVGKRLIRSQLLREDIPETSYPFNGTTGEEIKTPQLVDSRLYVSASGYFSGVTPEMFEFHLAGYQVCKNWASAGNKSGIQRKGSRLTREAAQSYRQVLFAIQETITARLLIDQILCEQLGW
jgi:predicted helicase